MTGDQVVDAGAAQRLHAEAISRRSTTAWIIMADQPDYPGKFVARLVTTEATPYVLLADSLVLLRDILPRGLDYSTRTPADPKGMIEFWFAPERV